MAQPIKAQQPLVLVNTAAQGMTFIPTPNPLTRLHYFDGKYLRAEHLQREQDYLLTLVRLANQAGGAGVVHGFDTVLAGSGSGVSVGPGMAIDPEGRTLLLPQALTLDLGELLERAQSAAAPAAPDVGAKPKQQPSSFASAGVAALGHAHVATDYAGVRARLGEVARAHIAETLAPARPAEPDRFAPCEPRAVSDSGPQPHGCSLYLLTVGHAEAYCGQEDVYGKLCAEACVTSTDRPWITEGVQFRLRPLVLDTPLAVSSAFPLTEVHLRSRVASAFFVDEAKRVGSLISGAGLRGNGFCLGAALAGGSDVPLAVVGIAGSTTCFLDAWTARRERIEAPPRRHWAWRMAMRPFDVYLAMVLQFQCQLHGLLRGIVDGGHVGDPCADEHEAIAEASEALANLERLFTGLRDRTELARGADLLDAFGGMTKVSALKTKLFALQRKGLAPRDRILLRGGIVELPPAGYLPVTPSAALSVNRQVRALLGEGVDLRYCVVRPDFVPEAFQEAQHMERISLLHGLDHPDQKPEVDVLVPNGVIMRSAAERAGMGFETTLSLAHRSLGRLTARGAARGEALPSGGVEFHFAGVGQAALTRPRRPAPELAPAVLEWEPAMAEAFAALSVDARKIALDRDRLRAQPALADIGRLAIDAAVAERLGAAWLTLRCEKNPIALGFAETTPARARVVLYQPTTPAALVDAALDAELRVTQVSSGPNQTRRVAGVVALSAALRIERPGQPPKSSFERPWLRIDFEYSVTGTRSEVQLRIVPERDPGAGSLVVRAQWGDSPLAIDITGALSTGDEKAQRVLAAKLEQSPTALQAGSAPYNFSISAIDILTAALDEVAFRESAKGALFPAPAKPDEELSVRATLDWVLFHRRRTKDCGRPTEAPAPVPPATYRVWHVDERKFGARGAIQIWDILRGGDESALRRLREAANLVADVVYDGGLVTLQSDPANVRQDYSAKNPGNELVLSVIATRGTHDDPIELGRSAILERVLQSISPRTKDAESKSLPEPNALFAPLGVQGAIILVTNVKAPATTCQSVYRFGLRREQLDDVLKGFAEQGRVNELLALTLPDGTRPAQKLADVSFELAGTTETEPRADLALAWSNAGGGSALRIYSFARPNDARVGTDAHHRDRTLAIAGHIGWSANTAIQHVAIDQELEPCPAVTVAFVVEEPIRRIARVVFVADGQPQPVEIGSVADSGLTNFVAARRAPDLTLEFVDDAITSARAFEQLLALFQRSNQTFERLELALPGPADPGADKRLKSLAASSWKPHLPAAGGRAVRTGLTAAERLYFNSPTPVDDVIFLHLRRRG